MLEDIIIKMLKKRNILWLDRVNT